MMPGVETPPALRLINERTNVEIACVKFNNHRRQELTRNYGGAPQITRGGLGFMMKQLTKEHSPRGAGFPYFRCEVGNAGYE